MNTHEREEQEFGREGGLWDAGDVCCAAFQLGACAHTEQENTLWCWDCGTELFEKDVEKQVKDNGFFSGKCAKCLDEYGTS